MPRTTLPAGAWTEVVSSAPSNFIEHQNSGAEAIRVYIGASAPSDDLEGFIYAPGEGDRVTVGLNKLFARPANDYPGRINTRTG